MHVLAHFISFNLYYFLYNHQNAYCLEPLLSNVLRLGTVWGIMWHNVRHQSQDQENNLFKINSSWYKDIKFNRIITIERRSVVEVKCKCRSQYERASHAAPTDAKLSKSIDVDHRFGSTINIIFECHCTNIQVAHVIELCTVQLLSHNEPVIPGVCSVMDYWPIQQFRRYFAVLLVTHKIECFHCAWTFNRIGQKSWPIPHRHQDVQTAEGNTRTFAQPTTFTNK